MSKRVIITPPAADPLTVDEAKLWCKQDLGNDDQIITELITLARELLETHVNKTFITTTYLQTFDHIPMSGGYLNPAVLHSQRTGYRIGGGGEYYPGFLPTCQLEIELDRPPLLSVTSIVYTDSSGNVVTLSGDTLTAAFYVSTGTPGSITPVYGTSWPLLRCQTDVLQITYQAGYGALATSVPKRAKWSCALIVAYLYQQRGTTNEPNAGVWADVDRLMSGEEWGWYVA